MQAGEHEKTVPWYRNGVLYQIYPLSFADSNGDGYGDIGGIIQHLDYLAGDLESLGVSALWLSPMYRSPMKDFGYDISDFRDIDPIFGTLQDFDRLISEVHARGMKLLMDFVPNHTSDQHSWFQEALRSKASKKRDWYIWANPKPDGSAPNNWLSRFGGSSWTYDEVSDQYYLHTFLSSQPDLNWRNPEVRAEMAETLRFWLKRGVDGFRTDSIYVLIKDEKLRDDPINPSFIEGESDPADRFLQKHSAGQTELLSVLDDICDIVAVDADSFLVSEAYLGIEEMKPLYRACQKHPIHAPFNFNLMTLKWGADSFGDWIDAYEASLGPNDVPNYVLGNHDRPRLASRVGVDRARLLAMLQMTLRGLPVVYYGDELGLENAVISPGAERDPWGIAVPGFGRDIARGLMPWSGEKNGGFTTGRPWLRASQARPSITVASEQRLPDSTFNLYRELIHLKATLPALHFGSYRRIKTDHPDIYAFAREYRHNRCLIIINCSDSDRKVSIEGSPSGQLLVSTHRVDGDQSRGDLGKVSLAAFEGQLYEISRFIS